VEPATVLSATAGAARDRAARGLLAVLIHRVSNTTQSVRAVEVLARDSRCSDFASDFVRTARDVEELGWLFGVLAAGLGSDVLVERVERARFEAVLTWAREAVRVRGGELLLAGVERVELIAPPRIAPRAAFGFALLAVLAAESVRSVRCELAIQDDAVVWSCAAPVDDDVAAWFAALGHGVLTRGAASVEWRLPREWFAVRGA
jgi:hypothetical protein